MILIALNGFFILFAFVFLATVIGIYVFRFWIWVRVIVVASFFEGDFSVCYFWCLFWRFVVLSFTWKHRSIILSCCQFNLTSLLMYILQLILSKFALKLLRIRLMMRFDILYVLHCGLLWRRSCWSLFWLYIIKFNWKCIWRLFDFNFFFHGLLSLSLDEFLLFTNFSLPCSIDSILLFKFCF